MDLPGSKRRIAELEARNAYLHQKIDDLTAKQAGLPVAPDWEAIAKQLATDRTKAERADRWQIARLEADRDVWIELSAAANRRIKRLARGAARYRKALAEQGSLIADQATRLDRWEGGDRALMPLPRTGADAVSQLNETRKQLAQRVDQITKLEALLATLQQANMDADRETRRPATHLQAAS
ncbi:hypothetical protein OG455_41855 [Kitasatospora sp. NBC_01287]|uniref:hypothetical protein n=1 Tax=Kitasatospora sp. NBC_01287 TaxID=2903573 RepID=UPI0022584B7A|nr:hypothetical protein [Kitasatospora sp. NBC_01287]MCX4751718.1 hypothetical protein [Kitasatospora sp. NBC_01287]MCX4751990.1 hypothetical protein [Kitasatospora sp. NBC_01287]